MPEPRFEELIVATLSAHKSTWKVEIDSTFMETCNAESLLVTSVSSTVPCVLGAEILDGVVIVSADRELSTPIKVTIRVSGVRKGDNYERFPIFTKEEMEANNAFWASSTKYER